MAKAALQKGNRVLVMVHKRELLDQASRSLHALGVDHGLIAPNHHGESSPIAVASVQTLDRRLKELPLHFDFIIIDEAHHAEASIWKRCLAEFPRAKLLGVTATPVRLDGKGLSSTFDDMIIGPSIRELIADGYLVQPEVFAPPVQLELDGIRMRASDYDPKELASRIDKPSLTGKAVEHYRKHCPNEPAIAFCASISHAISVRDSFREAGFKAEAISGDLPDHERRAMIDDLGSRRIDVLTSVDIVSEGTDIPIVTAAILLRPTKSLGLFMQQVGRVLRPAPNKRQAIILDHAGNSLHHGLPDDDREWSLDGVKVKRSKERDVTPIKQCQSCFAVFMKATSCPHCGHANVKETRPIAELEGELALITAEERARIRAQREAEEQATKDRVSQYRAATSWEEIESLAKQFGHSRFFIIKRWGKKFGRSI